MPDVGCPQGTSGGHHRPVAIVGFLSFGWAAGVDEVEASRLSRSKYQLLRSSKYLIVRRFMYLGAGL